MAVATLTPSLTAAAAAPPGAATAHRWYWRTGDDQGGPVTWDGLQSLAREGLLRPSDSVCREGANRWVRADSARNDPEPPERATAVATPPVATPLVATPPVPTSSVATPSVATPIVGTPANLPPAAATHAVIAAMPVAPRPPVAPASPGHRPSARPGESHAGAAVLAFVCALVGLLKLGILMGALAVGGGLQARRRMIASGNRAGVGFAWAAIVVGAVDVTVVLVCLATYLLDVENPLPFHRR